MPTDHRFPDELQEVTARKTGRRVILEPIDVWSREFLVCIGAWHGELPCPRRAPISKVRDPFS